MTNQVNAFGLPSKKSNLPATELSKSQVMSNRKLLLAQSADPLISKVIQVALDDDHPGQMSALKMCMDRLLPMQEFEAKKDGSRTAVTITISGVGDSVITGVAQSEPKEVEEVNIIDVEDV